MTPTKITVSAIINAPIDKVWDAFTNPTHIIHWNFASDDWCCPWATNDMQVGGKYCARMESKDGKYGFEFEAIYDEVIVKNKITYTGGGRQITTQFNNITKYTEVITTFDAETENPIELQKNGWQAILNNFKKYAEQL
jgi:uncharacterized protein YndB with AHSA1/START domain